MTKKKIIDISGEKYGRLTVIRFLEKVGRRSYWECVCDCGNVIRAEKSHLRSGHTKSCGCLKNEIVGNRNRRTGLSGTKIHFCYRNMINRCTWEKYHLFKDYGGRGITICPEWNDRVYGFERFVEWAFANGYREDLTLDRIDPDGNYCPENCRWVDKYVQANNKRHNLKLKINGEIDTIGNWARRLDLNYWNLRHYAQGGKNMKYPELEIEAVNE